MQTNTAKLFSFDIQTLEILKVLHLRKVAPRPEVLFFNRKMCHKRNRQISGTCCPGVSVH
jgi:hypothetical protein